MSVNIPFNKLLECKHSDFWGTSSFPLSSVIFWKNTVFLLHFLYLRTLNHISIRAKVVYFESIYVVDINKIKILFIRNQKTRKENLRS